MSMYDELIRELSFELWVCVFVTKVLTSPRVELIGSWVELIDESLVLFEVGVEIVDAEVEEATDVTAEIDPDPNIMPKLLDVLT